MPLESKLELFTPLEFIFILSRPGLQLVELLMLGANDRHLCRSSTIGSLSSPIDCARALGDMLGVRVPSLLSADMSDPRRLDGF